MKILLLNDNPVVNKLVTLSAQKTSDEVEISATVEGIKSQEYDLLIVDDSIYNDDLLHELETKIKYKKSLFICAKDAKEIDSFSSVLKKPFLPTDLVELFMMFEKEIKKEAEEMVEDAPQESDANENELKNLEELEDLELDDDLILDDEENFGESVLDDEEAQKVKDLLDENEEELSFEEEVQKDIESLELDELGVNEEELSLDEEVQTKESEEEDLLAAYEMALDLEDEADADISEGESFDLEDEVEAVEAEKLEELETATVEELEDEIDEAVTDELNAQEGELAVDLALDLEDEADADISLDPVDDLELESFEESEEAAKVTRSEDASLEDKIQNAVENLTQEDLESELDEDTLLQIATNEIDPLESLTSKDLKEALGEEVEEDGEALPDFSESKKEENSQPKSGAEALKKLLEALSDKDVAASMKGMKISINITLEESE